MSGLNLTLRQRATWLAHTAKSVTQDHHREMEPMLRQFIPEDGVVIDVGAHAGQMTRMFADLAPRGHVYSFEPATYARSILEIAVKLRRVRNVTILTHALGDNEGQLTLATPLKRKARSMGYGLTHVTDGTMAPAANEFTETVRATTLDTYAVEAGLTRLDFVKVDIEGWEGRFLAGAERTLARFHPALLLELHAEMLKRGGDTPEDILASLTALGYRAMKLPDISQVSPQYDGPGDYLFVAR
ncbi:MAG: FkbM family methyltransferase [Caulobacterales bacterium]